MTYPGGTDTYEYNALGQRMRWIRNGYTTRYVYCGERVLEENSYAGTVLAWHTPSSGSYYTPWLHMQRWNTGHSYPLYNGIGTVRGLVDGDGVRTDSYSMDVFGVDLGGSGSTPAPYKFGGAWGYLTDSSGLLQLGARFYWPELGRFIQQDPIGDGVNWYAYAGNNPVRWVDPEGYGLRDTLKEPFVMLGAWIGGKIERHIGRQNGLTPQDLGLVSPNGLAAAGGAAAIAGTAVAGAGVVAGSVCEASGRSGAIAAAARTGAIAGGAGLALGVAGGILTHEQLAPQAEASVTAMNNRITNPSGSRSDLFRMVNEENVYGDEDVRHMYSRRRY